MLKMTSGATGKMFLTIDDTEIMIIVKQDKTGLEWMFDAPLEVKIERASVRLRRLKGEE